ncbi:MAG: hypothetical protein OXU61_13970 [Gammaproteobacteria bacterium]|nr:hypothetical protein [Gammaproteobacteria bacterium]
MSERSRQMAILPFFMAESPIRRLEGGETLSARAYGNPFAPIE